MIDRAPDQDPHLLSEQLPAPDEQSTPENLTVILVPHSHMDTAWYKRRGASKMREAEIFNKAVAIKLPFTVEQTSAANDYITGIGEHNEATFKELASDGTFEMTPLHIQPDVFLGGEEAMYQSLEIGMEQIKKWGGTPSNAVYIPDTFGFPASMPQILKGAGFDNLIFARGLGDEIETLGAVFNWEGDDGSQILAIPMQGSYGNGYEIAKSGSADKRYDSEHITEADVVASEQHLRTFLERYGKRFGQVALNAVLLGNGGDVTLPSTRMPKMLPLIEERVAKDYPGVTLKVGSYSEYIDLVKQSLDPALVQTFQGELRSGKEHPVVRGVDSIRIPLKQAIGKAEREIYAAEAMMAFLALGRKYGAIKNTHPNSHRTEDLIYSSRSAVRSLLPTLSHDAVAGCGADDIYSYMLSLADDAYDEARQVVRSAGAALVDEHELYQPTPGYGDQLSVVSLTAGARLQPVSFKLQGELRCAGSLSAYTVQGGEEIEVPIQIEEREDGRFGVAVMPIDGIGSSQLHIRQSEKLEEFAPAGTSIENEFYTVDQAGGRLRITSKANGASTYGLVFEDTGDRGDTYNYNQAEGGVELNTEFNAHAIADGPAFSELLVTTTMLVPESLDGKLGARRSSKLTKLPISTTVRLYKGVDRVECATTVDNTARDHRLRVVFSAPEAGSTVRAKEPYSSIERPAVPIQGGNDWAEPLPVATSHTASFVSAGKLVFTAKNLPEYEAIPGEDGAIKEVATTLLRSVGWLSRSDLETRPGSAGPEVETPDAQLPGKQTFHYAIDLNGIASNSRIIQNTNAYLHDLQIGPRGIQLDQILRIDEGNAVLSKLGPTADGTGVVARFYNPNHEPATVLLEGVFASAVRCNAVTAEPLDDADASTTTLAPGEIVTIRLS